MCNLSHLPKLLSVIGCSFWVTFGSWSYMWCLNCLMSTIGILPRKSTMKARTVPIISLFVERRSLKHNFLLFPRPSSHRMRKQICAQNCFQILWSSLVRVGTPNRQVPFFICAICEHLCVLCEQGTRWVNERWDHLTQGGYLKHGPCLSERSSKHKAIRPRICYLSGVLCSGDMKRRQNPPLRFGT